jgi:hypothetical protein
MGYPIVFKNHRSVKQADLKKELQWVIDYQGRLINDLADSDNPQIIRDHGKLVASNAAFQAVLDRMNGGMDLRLFYH